MRWIVFLFLWVVAVVLAVLILRRVRRGKPVVLTGRWSPRLVRMVVVVLVVLGVGDEPRPPEASAAPLKLPARSSDDELPKAITPHTIQTWLIVHQEGGPYARHETALARALMAGQPIPKNLGDAAGPPGGPGGAGFGLPEVLQRLINADLAARKADKPLPKASAAEVRAALDELEKAGRYDHFWNAYLWRKTADFANPADRVELYARFRRHARVTDALIRAHAQAKPLMTAPRAWMGKAGPPPGWERMYQPQPNAGADLLKVAAEVLPTTDDGTWKRDGVALFKPVAGRPAPAVVRGGTKWALPADESTRFGRLDLFKTGDKPAAVNHDWLGQVELPANKLISVWELPDLLPEAARRMLDETVHDALKSNSMEAADRLERCLAVSHQAIRVGLKELPKAKGAPRLRLILALFDDTVMPGLPNYRGAPAPDELFPGSGRFGGG
jgi:hypothetical protein